MPPDRKPVAEVVAATRERLVNRGFRKRTGEIFTLTVTEDALGWLGLNRAVERSNEVLEMNTVVGVRHQGVERLVADMKGERFHPYIPPTVSLHLGYLMPERRYQPWLFVEGGVNEEADRMVDAVLRFGVPFMERHSTLETLLRLMLGGEVGIRDQLAMRIPIVYRLLGEEARARKELDSAVRELDNRRDVAAERLRAFAERFSSAGPSTSTSKR